MLFLRTTRKWKIYYFFLILTSVTKKRIYLYFLHLLLWCLLRHKFRHWSILMVNTVAIIISNVNKILNFRWFKTYLRQLLIVIVILFIIIHSLRNIWICTFFLFIFLLLKLINKILLCRNVKLRNSIVCSIVRIIMIYNIRICLQIINVSIVININFTR